MLQEQVAGVDQAEIKEAWFYGLLSMHVEPLIHACM